MITYIERVESHQLFTLLEQGLQLSNTILHYDNLNHDMKEHVERINYAYDQIKSSLKNYDQVLLPINILNNGTTPLTNVNNSLQNYINQRQNTYLHDANNFLDGFLNQMPPFLLPRSYEEIENFRETISSYRRSVAQHNRNTEEEYKRLQEENNRLRNQINDMVNQVNSEKQRVDNFIIQFQQQIANFQQQFSQAEDKRRDTFSQDLDEWRNKYEQEKVSRNQTYNELAAYLQKQNEEFEQSLEQDHQKMQQQFENEAKVILNIITDHKSQVEKLVDVITNTGLASGYQKVANEEKTAKKFWRFITVTSMLLLIGFAAFVAYESYSKEFNLVTFGAKIFGALSVGTLVAFAARQASLHGQAERANRKLELELTAIGPYLVGFTETEIQEIKRTLVTKFFGKDEPTNSSNEELPKGSIDAIKLALETVQHLVKGK